jgi:hypothetical protein
MDGRFELVDPMIRDRVRADHRGLERLVEQVLAAGAADDTAEAQRLWAELASRLFACLETEAAHFIPALLRVCERGARVLLEQHRHLRRRLVELGARVAAGTFDPIRVFADELRAHAESEERLLARWEPSSSVRGTGSGVHEPTPQRLRAARNAR